MKRNVLLILFLLLVLLLAAPALAQQSAVTDDEVNDVAGELFCPVCENTPLDVCPTQACSDWRELIRTLLSEGRSKQEIKDYFALQYGDRVLAEPPQTGFDLVVWLLPLGAVVIGGFFFYRYMRSLQRAQTELPGKPTPAGADTNQVATARDDYAARIEQEIKKG
ncbi:MAG: cytochrome c-type biogenesis protein CcmH [Ardenticatenaceae bacterium]|nr:cytochrome c-type biogenesis protein CcmH [Ardenticatenaceae bacterium]